MGRGRSGFTDEEIRQLEAMPGARVTRVNLSVLGSDIKPVEDRGDVRGSRIHTPSKVCEDGYFWDSKTELRFSRTVLADLVRDHTAVIRWRYNDTKYRLADRAWYKPDFHIDLEFGRMAIVEVKGPYIHDKVRDRIKTLAEIVAHPFYLAQWTGKRWEINRLASRTSAGNRCDLFKQWERQ